MVKQPWQAEIDGLLLPAAVADHPALELANTWAGWSPDGDQAADGRDYLTSPAHLAALARDRGLVAAGWSGEVTEADLAEARAFRPHAYRLALGRGHADDVAALGRLAAEARGHQRLVRAGPTGAAVRWERPADPRHPGRDPLLATAALLADLLEHDPGRVRACPGRGCGWQFLNASGRRRWCLMAVCGNRAKQAAHAARVR